MAVLEVEESSIFTIDDEYEFSAPRFFDFIKEESENEKRSAEIWLDSSLSYAPSPFMPKIKTCEEANEVACTQETGSATGVASSCSAKVELAASEYKKSAMQEACTLTLTHLLQSYPRNHQTDEKIATKVRNPSSLKSQNQPPLSHAKSTKPTTVIREANLKNRVATPNFALENQPIKRQKLEGGRSRQIVCIKTQNLPHKTRPGVSSSSSNLSCPSTTKTHKEDRKVYVRVPAAPFVSMAEMIQKFQTNTRDLTRVGAASVSQRKPKLTLTRPREPEFETSQRVRSVRIQSSTELEEKIMDKIPKFKAKPVNKKILGAPTLLAPPRSTPHLPEFQEFHLETMERANQNAETSRVASTESAPRSHQWKPHLTAPKSPVLQTYLRARPPRIKSSEDEELDKVPKFKAKPLNRKILESKGDVGIFWHTKREVTVPKEFRFATDDRIPSPVTVSDLFEKLTMNSEPHQYKQIPRNTTPNPFHFRTEERGSEKERKFVTEAREKQLEVERTGIRKANPFPYTTDHPVIPRKYEANDCTNPEPFQLGSLVREEEMQRERKERPRIEKEKAQLRVFKAQPRKEHPIPVSVKAREPLTEVQDFNLLADHRAVDRAEFDKNFRRRRLRTRDAELMPSLLKWSSKGVAKPESSQLRVN